jgi:hypothetical protein
MAGRGPRRQEWMDACRLEARAVRPKDEPFSSPVARLAVVTRTLR